MTMQESPKENSETVEEDQKDRPYYYDDSHGYEDYDAEEEDDVETGDTRQETGD